MTSQTTGAATSRADETIPPRVYVLVLVIEAAVIAGLYWLGVHFQ